MFVINYGIVGLLEFFQRVLGMLENRAPLGKTLFFVFLFTVITVLFDRYRTVLTARGVLQTREDNVPAQPASGPTHEEAPAT